MAGVSMTVLKVIEDGIFEEMDEGETRKIEPQQNFNDLDETDPGALSENSRTDIEKISEDDSFSRFSVDMSTKKKEEPIYIYINEIERHERGYQPISKFEMWHNREKNLLFIFVKKKVASKFARRLRRHKDIKTKPVEYMFDRITELHNLDNAWGQWRDAKGRIQRKGLFGDGMENEMDDPGEITTLYIDYQYATEVVQLILSEGGSLSTRQDISKEDLHEIYRELEDDVITVN